MEQDFHFAEVLWVCKVHLTVGEHKPQSLSLV